MSAPSMSRIPSLNSTAKRLSVNNLTQVSTNDENAAPAVTTTRKSLANNAGSQPPRSILKRAPSNDSTAKSVAAAPRAALAPINTNTNGAAVSATPSSAKSYSELKKSEQLLQERVAELEKKLAAIQAAEDNVQSEHRSHVTALQQQQESEVSALKQSNTQKQSTIDRSEQLIASLREQLVLQQAEHTQQIEELTARHTSAVIETESKLQEALNRVVILEAKLEHCGINIITMAPFVLSEDAKDKELKLSAELETKIATLTARVAEMKVATMSRLASVRKWKQEEEIATQKS